MIDNVSKKLIGKKVRFVGKPTSEFYELFAPNYDTIGTITDFCGGNMEVEWPKGSVVNDGAFWYTKNELELVEEMTNEEIWEMLRPKLVKNGLDWIHYGYDSEGNKFYYFDKKALMNAVATAYKSGYYRSQKGRPFKIGEKKVEEKKKGGHWEPVDPNNLPKEGTMVRYSRHIDGTNTESFSKWTGIQIGEMTTVRRIGNEFWVEDIHDKNNGYPVCSYLHPERFDVWKEDEV